MSILKLLGVTVTLLFLAVGCAGNSSGEEANSTRASGVQSGTTGADATIGETRATREETAETTRGDTTEASQAEDVGVEQISSGAQGPEQRQILIASSAQSLAAATGLEVPDAGQGTYVAVAWGEKPTGGYTVGFESASVKGVRVMVGVELKNPPPDAMVAQALTYPYAVAVLRGVDPGEKEFVFVTRNGREIGWPVRSV